MSSEYKLLLKADSSIQLQGDNGDIVLGDEGDPCCCDFFCNYESCDFIQISNYAYGMFDADCGSCNDDAGCSDNPSASWRADFARVPLTDTWTVEQAYAAINGGLFAGGALISGLSNIQCIGNGDAIMTIYCQTNTDTPGQIWQGIAHNTNTFFKVDGCGGPDFVGICCNDCTKSGEDCFTSCDGDSFDVTVSGSSIVANGTYTISSTGTSCEWAGFFGDVTIFIQGNQFGWQLAITSSEGREDFVQTCPSPSPPVNDSSAWKPLTCPSIGVTITVNT